MAYFIICDKNFELFIFLCFFLYLLKHILILIVNLWLYLVLLHWNTRIWCFLLFCIHLSKTKGLLNLFDTDQRWTLLLFLLWNAVIASWINLRVAFVFFNNVFLHIILIFFFFIFREFDFAFWFKFFSELFHLFNWPFYFFIFILVLSFLFP